MIIQLVSGLKYSPSLSGHSILLNQLIQVIIEIYDYGENMYCCKYKEILPSISRIYSINKLGSYKKYYEYHCCSGVLRLLEPRLIILGSVLEKENQ